MRVAMEDTQVSSPQELARKSYIQVLSSWWFPLLLSSSRSLLKKMKGICMRISNQAASEIKKKGMLGLKERIKQFKVWTNSSILRVVSRESSLCLLVAKLAGLMHYISLYNILIWRC
jgi:hypothetical protein